MSCGFTKVDLQNIINIIDVCTKRGAFQAEELSGVGQLYDKLKKSLNCCKQEVTKSVEEVTKSVEEVTDSVEGCKLDECVDGVCPISNCGT
jgi:hypothetical protein